MPDDRDGYEAWYAARLWALMPGVYRAEDGEDGPLRALLARIGAQAAVVRRSLDRSWEDRFAESCDDWLLPYHAELVDARPVAGMDARARRLDVANTISYRRRKGTVALLEELAADVTGWHVRVVEFFRRLGRTRHGFDPAFGADAVLQGLRGARSLTPAGGFADLRHAGAAQAGATAFDEFAHLADVRRGRDGSGWHAIPRLGVFLWRLGAFGMRATTPVERAGCPGQFTFDPTGREIPLFARGRPARGEAWTSPEAWALPGPIDATLLAEATARLWPDSLSVLSVSGPLVTPLPASAVAVEPERGRLRLLAPLPAGAVPRVTYHAALAGEIGAGPHDRRALGEAAATAPPPRAEARGGGGALAAALGALAGSGTVTLADSLTLDAVADLAGVADIVLRAAPNERPVIRPPAGTAWVIEGAGPDARLALEGLLVTGCDIVLRGSFAEVSLLGATLDPGEALDAAGEVPRAIDDRPLRPVTLWIEGSVGLLRLRRCIAGPVRTRGRGRLLRIEAADSILQGVRQAGQGAFAAGEVFDARHLALRWRSGQDPLTAALRPGFAPALAAALAAWSPAAGGPDAALSAQLRAGLDAVAGGAAIWDPARFAHLALPPALVAQAMAGTDLPRVNRLLLEAAYPVALAPAAVAATELRLSLARCTVLGELYVHRISASGSILAGFARASDIQEGCVRFSAALAGSRLHRPYESVAIRPGGVFVSRRFGDPGYAQLARLADREIVGGEPAATLTAGGEDGSEMGAFASARATPKERALMARLRDYAPVGVAPVPIHVT